MLLRRGAFDNHRISDSRTILAEGYSRTRSFSTTTIRSGSGVPVFISHKHSDLNDLSGLLGFLQKYYTVNPYLDCFDEEMPLKTCAETAVRIKQVIEYCPKFIFLATEDALSSKWCNWEVGIADKWKLTGNNMAILPLLEKGKEPKSYKGNEYLQIYPYIETALNLTGSGSHLVVNCPTSSGWKQFEFRNWLYNQLND